MRHDTTSFQIRPTGRRVRRGAFLVWFAAVGAVATLSADAPAASPLRQGDEQWTFRWGQGEDQRAHAIHVDNSTGAATTLSIADNSLRDERGYALGQGKLRLARTVDDKGAAPVAIPANSRATVFLVAEQGEGVGPFGYYTGQVNLKLGDAAVHALPLKIRVSSTAIKWLGVFLAAVGLGLFYLLNVLWRPRLVRLQALRPAAALREAVLEFLARLKATSPACPGLARETEAMAGSLTLAELDRLGLLPPKFGVSVDPFDLSALKAHLTAASTKFTALVALRQGVDRVMAAHQDDPAKAAAAARLLDDYAAGCPDAAAAAAKIAEVLGAARLMAFDGGAAEMDVRRIDFEIKTVAGLVSVVWALASLAVAGVWVITDTDFGTAIDLIGCFLWGLGITAFGAGVKDLTPTTIASKLQIKVP